MAGGRQWQTDAYEYDVASGRVHLLSSGTSNVASYVVDASPNGDDVFIVTRDRLVGWDVDDQLRPLRRACGRRVPGAAGSRRRRVLARRAGRLLLRRRG